MYYFYFYWTVILSSRSFIDLGNLNKHARPVNQKQKNVLCHGPRSYDSATNDQPVNQFLSYNQFINAQFALQTFYVWIFGSGLGYVIFSLVRIPAFLKEIFKDVGAVPSL